MPKRKTLDTVASRRIVRGSRVVVASIPGRLRLKAPCLRDVSCCHRLAARLRAVEAVLSVEPSEATGSLLVHYDAGQCSVPAFEDISMTEFDAVFLRESRDAATSMSAGGGVSRRESARRWNRVAKIGMLAGLPISLALAAVGSKKLHAATGGVFSLLLVVHLLVHRRHLLK